MDKQNLFNFDPSSLAAFFTQLGDKPFRATQVMKWLYQQGVTDFEQMTNLSKNLRKQLSETATVELPEIVIDQASSDGTHKWLLRLADGNCIEMVFIPESDRGTLCISSQVGCVLNCSFCSTAQQGFNRNLSTAEIIGQVFVAAKTLGQFALPADKRIVTNIVFMGMGEPLLNYDAVLSAVRILLDDNAFGLSKRRVTISTSGVVPALDQLAKDTDVALAVSLHATDNALRDELVPINKKYPIEVLLESCKNYLADNSARAKITVEYVMLKGVNDQPSHARALIKLLRDVPSKVNLIPFNPFPHTRYERSDQAAIDRFQEILIAGGLITITRRTRGDDIDAACGQLAGQVKDRTRRTFRLQQSIGE